MKDILLSFIIYIYQAISTLLAINLSWLSSLGPVVLLFFGSFVGYLFKGHLQKRASKIEVTNKLIDSIEVITTEMRKQAFQLLKSEENNSIEISHHIFVAQNARLQKICQDIVHHDKKNHPSIPIDKLRAVKKACDEIIENHHSAHVYGSLIFSQSELLDSFRYVTAS